MEKKYNVLIADDEKEIISLLRLFLEKESITVYEAYDDKIYGLELGADDYITKPFEPLEVVARVKAHLRRNEKSIGQSVDSNDENSERIITCKNLVLNLDRCQLTVDNNIIDLTKIELNLMEMFMESPGRVYTKEQIFERGWDDVFVDDNTIRVTISRLRDKIGGDRIKTIRGLGYRLEVS